MAEEALGASAWALTETDAEMVTSMQEDYWGALSGRKGSSILRERSRAAMQSQTSQ